MRSFARQSNRAQFQLLIATGAVAVLGLLLPGCTRNDEILMGRAIPIKPSQALSGRPFSGRGFTIGISLSPSDDLYRAARNGMDAAAADNEVLLDLQSAEATDESQRRHAMQLIANRVNALIVWTRDAKVATDTVQAANGAGVPVFTIGVKSGRSRATAHFVTCTPLLGLSPEQIGRKVIDKVAAYLRGEKLKPEVVIRPESADTLNTK